MNVDGFGWKVKLGRKDLQMLKMLLTIMIPGLFADHPVVTEWAIGFRKEITDVLNKVNQFYN